MIRNLLFRWLVLATCLGAAALAGPRATFAGPLDGALETARAAEARLDFRAALAAYDAAIDALPEAVDAYVARADLHRRMNRPALALDDLDAALARAPQDSAARALRGDLHLALGALSRAIADFDAVLETAPDSVPALVGRARARTRSGLTELALADYDKALALVPDTAGLADARAALIVARTAPDPATLRYDPTALMDPAFRIAEGDSAAPAALVIVHAGNALAGEAAQLPRAALTPALEAGALSVTHLFTYTGRDSSIWANLALICAGPDGFSATYGALASDAAQTALAAIDAGHGRDAFEALVASAYGAAGLDPSRGPDCAFNRSKALAYLAEWTDKREAGAWRAISLYDSWPVFVLDGEVMRVAALRARLDALTPPQPPHAALPARDDTASATSAIDPAPTQASDTQPEADVAGAPPEMPDAAPPAAAPQIPAAVVPAPAPALAETTEQSPGAASPDMTSPLMPSGAPDPGPADAQPGADTPGPVPDRPDTPSEVPGAAPILADATPPVLADMPARPGPETTVDTGEPVADGEGAPEQALPVPAQAPAENAAMAAAAPEDLSPDSGPGPNGLTGADTAPASALPGAEAGAVPPPAQVSPAAAQPEAARPKTRPMAAEATLPAGFAPVDEDARIPADLKGVWAPSLVGCIAYTDAIAAPTMLDTALPALNPLDGPAIGTVLLTSRRMILFNAVGTECGLVALENKEGAPWSARLACASAVAPELAVAMTLTRQPGAGPAPPPRRRVGDSAGTELVQCRPLGALGRDFAALWQIDADACSVTAPVAGARFTFAATAGALTLTVTPDTPADGVGEISLSMDGVALDTTGLWVSDGWRIALGRFDAAANRLAQGLLLEARDSGAEAGGRWARVLPLLGSSRAMAALAGCAGG